MIRLKRASGDWKSRAAGWHEWELTWPDGSKDVIAGTYADAQWFLDKYETAPVEE
jgi:hypothetical protein